MWGQGGRFSYVTHGAFLRSKINSNLCTEKIRAYLDLGRFSN